MQMTIIILKTTKFGNSTSHGKNNKAYELNKKITLSYQTGITRYQILCYWNNHNIYTFNNRL